MPGIARANLDTVGGGSVAASQTSVLSAGNPVIRSGDKVSAHWWCGFFNISHCIATIKAKHKSGVYIEGIEVVVGDDWATCFHGIKPGSPNVMAGQPRTFDRLGPGTAAGGKHVAGGVAPGGYGF